MYQKVFFLVVSKAIDGFDEIYNNYNYVKRKLRLRQKLKKSY